MSQHILTSVHLERVRVVASLAFGRHCTSHCIFMKGKTRWDQTFSAPTWHGSIKAMACQLLQTQKHASYEVEIQLK